MSNPDANDHLVSHNYILWDDVSLRESRWKCINSNELLFGKLKRTFFA